MASLTFFGLRIVVAVGGLALLAFNWRLGLVVYTALALDFLTLLWMVLPFSSLLHVGGFLAALGLIVGAALAFGRTRLPPWQPAAVLAATLVLLRGSYVLTGLLSRSVSRNALMVGVPADLVLVCAPSCGVLLGAMAIRGAARLLRGSPS